MKARDSIRFALAAAALGLAMHAGPAAAEVSEVRIAQQFGISYLPLMIMEKEKLLEKHAKEAGLGDIKVTWSRFAGGNVMNEALLSGSLHFASGGVGPFTTLWARTRGNLDVRGVTAMNVMPLYLTTRNANVKTIKDFTEKDRIALPAVKVSIQAVTLQMAAEQAFGEGNHSKLDALTVTMSHPDGQAALLSGASEITGHFSSPPFQYQQLRQPGIHRVLSSYDVLGGPATFNVIWTTAKVRSENPKTYAAFLKAYKEAQDRLNGDKRWAAQFYLDTTGDKRSTLDDILAMLNDPEIAYTMEPRNVTKYSDFMHKVGSIKVKPSSWKEMFFEDLEAYVGK